jgi:uncharacterized heparinase superfamily protein
MAGRSLIDRLPGRPAAEALLVAARRRLGEELAGTPPHRWWLAQGRPDGLAAMPRDLRPANVSAGRQILAGAFVLGGETLASGVKGDPWNRPSPSRRFAVALHRFGWMRDLLATGPEGAGEGLRLTLEWSRAFGRWNAFAWHAEVLERRVFNLACATRTLAARASDAEAARLAHDLARQARLLLQLDPGPARATERAAAAAVAGAALAGRAGERLLAVALKRLRRLLPRSVMHDGGHASRSPQAALELLFDLCTLDEALTQRGAAPPEELARALHSLAAAVRFATLADGRLAAFHGGEALERGYVAAARAQDDSGERPVRHSLGGYQRLDGRALQVVADAAAPPSGAWSVAACAQPLAIEVLADGRRMIVGGGWSPDAQAPQAMRLVDAASTVSIGDAPCGEPLRGFAARVLGPQLAGGVREVECRRHEAPGALWLELAHDGWVERFGLRHERRLYLDVENNELRGEDRFTPAGRPRRPGDRQFAPFMVRFHLDPEVQAQIARERKSVLLRAEGSDRGWWLRNDAVEVALEPSLHYRLGQARRTQQIVLRGQVRIAQGARLRWKLSAVGGGDLPRVDVGGDGA